MITPAAPSIPACGSPAPDCWPGGETDACALAHLASGRRKLTVIVALAVVLAMAAMLGATVGSSGVAPLEALAAALNPFYDEADRVAKIVWSLRLPRVAAGALIGLGLAWAGALSQACLRNPLASPFTLGVASGAGFGAALAMFFFPQASQGSPWLIPACAFAASMATSGFILGVSRMRGAGPETLILAGVAVMFLFSAMTSFIQYAAPQQELHRIVFWFFGSLSKVGWREIGIMAVMVLLPAVWLLRAAWDLNILPAGDETAKSLGVDVDRLRFLGILVMALMTAGSICFTGVIGFIGLVAPHLGRLLVGGDHRFLLPAAGLIGAVLVAVSDLLGRWLFAPSVLPIGIMTSFLGVPFFFWLLMAGTRRRAG